MREIIRSGGASGRQTPEQREKDGVEYLIFPAIENTGIAEHLFSTRLGGVSRGIYSSMSLSFTRGDEVTAVSENYRRIGRILQCPPERMVAAHQTHTTNIRLVTEEDCGKGIVRERDYEDIDGLVTDCPGICLVTYFADCVPIYLVDPVKKAIGLAHSGWRGTVAGMGERMVQTMAETFGSKPEDLVAAIGPSICQACYEVSEDVAQAFASLAQTDLSICGEDPQRRRLLEPGRAPGKYQLDLWRANELILRRAGVLPERISVTDICTCHNPEYLFSHRASQGKRGNLGAFLMLKPSERS